MNFILSKNISLLFAWEQRESFRIDDEKWVKIWHKWESVQTKFPADHSAEGVVKFMQSSLVEKFSKKE